MRARFAFVAMTLIACGPAEAPSASCGEPDRVCPLPDAPYEGARCEGAELECFYAHPAFPSDPRSSRFTCDDGTWREEVLCEGCPPRTYEACSAPITPPIAGALVRVELAEDPIVVGAQGAAMLAHTIVVEGLGDRSCVSVRERAILDGTPAPGELDVTMHCGRTLTVYAILPMEPCEPGTHQIELEVEVLGAGAARASLAVEGAGCAPSP